MQIGFDRRIHFHVIQQAGQFGKGMRTGARGHHLTAGLLAVQAQDSILQRVQRQHGLVRAGAALARNLHIRQENNPLACQGRARQGHVQILSIRADQRCRLLRHFKRQRAGLAHLIQPLLGSEDSLQRKRGIQAVLQR